MRKHCTIPTPPKHTMPTLFPNLCCRDKHLNMLRCSRWWCFASVLGFGKRRCVFGTCWFGSRWVDALLGFRTKCVIGSGSEDAPICIGLSVGASRVWVGCGVGAVPPTMNTKPHTNYFNHSKSKFGFSCCACLGSGSCKCVTALQDIILKLEARNFCLTEVNNVPSSSAPTCVFRATQCVVWKDCFFWFWSLLSELESARYNWVHPSDQNTCVLGFAWHLISKSQQLESYTNMQNVT